MTLKLFIGNKVYSSWSMRGWLAVRQSGLPFEEHVASLYGDEWDARRAAPEFAPSNGKVPILWDGDNPVWESLAIVDYLADKVGRDVFWPKDDAARAFARSIAAEMHAGYQALRSEHTMNMRHVYPPAPLSPDVQANVTRIVSLWDQARTRFGARAEGGGPYLFGAFGAADIMFAPVVTRFRTYSIPIPAAAQDYCTALLAHPFVQEWAAGAAGESWVIDMFERG